MPIWFQAGGWTMWFILLFSALALLTAARFAWRPDPSQFDRIQQLSRAVGWSMLSGVASDIAAVATHVPENPAWAHSPDVGLIILGGIGESMSPAILGSGALAVVALFCAAGHARLCAQGVSP